MRGCRVELFIIYGDLFSGLVDENGGIPDTPTRFLRVPPVPQRQTRCVIFELEKY